MSKEAIIYKYSNPTEVYRRAKKYLGKTAKIGLSTKKDKYSPNNLAIKLLW